MVGAGNENEAATRRRCLFALAALGLLHRGLLLFLHLEDMKRLFPLFPRALTWQYPTPEGMLDAFWGNLWYLQQSPPLPVIILGAGMNLFGWPLGTAIFCLSVCALLAVAAGMLLFRLLHRVGVPVRTTAFLAAVFLLSLDLVLVEYYSFGQLFYEHLSMVLLLFIASSLAAWGPAPRPKQAFGIGLAVALLALTRATFSFFFVVPALFILLRPAPRRATLLASFLLPVVVLHGGWSLKNMAAYGTARVSTSTWGGFNLVHGMESVGLHDDLRRDVLASPRLYPAWFIEAVRRHRLEPWPYLERHEFPAEIEAEDLRIQNALDWTNRGTNTVAARVLSDLYIDAALRFTWRHPLKMLDKAARSYEVFWQPTRNNPVQFLGILFVDPVVLHPFRVDAFVGHWLRGELPERQYVKAGRAVNADLEEHQRRRIVALAVLPLWMLLAGVVTLHLLVPVVLVRWLRGRGRPQVPALYLFCIAAIGYAAVVICMAEHIENMRYRLPVEPLIWVLTLSTWVTLFGAKAPPDDDPGAAR